MFGRVAACSVAAFLVVSPAPSSGETRAFADMDAPLATTVTATTQDQAQEQNQEQTENQKQAQARDDAQAQVKVAALDPAEPSVKSPAVTGPAIQSPAVAEPFGLTAVPVGTGDLLAKWSGVEADIRAESEILARCRDSAERCPAVARTFLAIIAAGRALTGRARIGVINRAVNLAIHPMSDLEQWGVPDRWSAPLDTLTSGLGDCEDYAIAKYVALKEAGVAENDLRLVIVRNVAAGEDHAVAAARLDGNWIMLDNRWLTLVEDSKMRRVIPLFVLDDDGVRQFAPAARYAAAPASFAEAK
jgi:predicted transglutaminase-like cysteine proteinase